MDWRWRGGGITGEHKRTDWIKLMNKSIILLAALIILSLIIFCWPKEQLEITRLNELRGETAAVAVAAVKNVCEVSALRDDAKLRKVMIPMIDGMGFREYKNLLAGIKSPSFDKVKVLTPSFNSEICYVCLPESRNCAYQFTLRKKDGKLLLESICRKDN
jgi:hypothetical protein